MDQVGYAVCHQLPERTLHYGGRPLPVCARDTGLFLGFAAVFCAFLLIYGGRGTRYPSWKMIVALSLLFLPFVVDSVTSYAGIRETSNAVRVVTGALAGSAAASLIYPLAARGLFQGDGREAVLGRWWSCPALLSAPASVCLLLWPEWAGGYWFWGIAVTLSILFTFFVLSHTLVYLLVDRSCRKRKTPGRTTLFLLSAALAVSIIAVSNGLHHLADKVL